MPDTITRRDVMKSAVGFAGVISAVGLADFVSAATDADSIVPFTDFPGDFTTHPRADMRVLDTRAIQSFITPSDEFFVVQHYGQPVVDVSTFRLQITGLVKRSQPWTLEDLKKRPRSEFVAGFECSGNGPKRMNGLIGNARWTGTTLAGLLKECGLLNEAREIVFFGADKGEEEVSHGGFTTKVEQRFARSLALEDALKPEVLVAYEMNGAPLSVGQGAPVRLIVPGWYGVANIKWLEQIHVQDTRFMGKFMAREYVTLRGEPSGQGVTWNETSVGRMLLKSMVTRVNRKGNSCQILGFALTDGTPLKAVEVQIDGGPWRTASLDKGSTPYSWKLFTYTWQDSQPGEHAIVSRAIDATGRIQPTEQELESKKTRWENNAQLVRRVRIG
ncbi:MAG: sulfite oxidase [Terriglobia bacterium]